MSIDNMLAALEEAEDEREALTIVISHLAPENGFYVRGVPAHSGISQGLFAIDLNASSIDAIYAHVDGYFRLKSLEDICEFLSCFMSKGELEKALRESGYEKLLSI